MAQLFQLVTSQLAGLIDFEQKSLIFSALSIAFNPLFWNTLARLEYSQQTLSSRLFRHNRLYACYSLAISIFLLGLFRDFLYERALRHQPLHRSFHQPILGYTLLAIGNTLVVSSTYALGIVGTYLGDYFGILMEEPVTGFPFSLTGAPMYYGSAMSFFGTALVYGRPAGVVLSLEVLVVYLLALRFEDPFTDEIYAKRDRERKEGKEGKKAE